MKKKHCILFLILNCCTLLLAQQMPVISNYERVLPYLNPGAIGNDDALAIDFMHRNQWTGFEGSPATQVFCVHTPLKNPKVAMGLLLEHESIGSINYTGAYLNYAYRMNLSSGKLCFGLKFGINAGSHKNISLRDEVFDRAFADKSKSFILPNFGAGVFYYNNKYWGGFSIPRLFGFESSSSGSYRLSHDMNRYEYTFTGGTSFGLIDDIDIKPHVLIVASPVFKTHVTLNVSGVYKNTFIAGLGFRTFEAIILQLGYNLNRQFSILYSYDFNIGKIQGYSYGSHEINLQYIFGYQINVNNPRQF